MKKRFVWIIALVIALALAVIAGSAYAASNVCPENGEWSTHQSPETFGEVVGAVEYCVKGGNTDNNGNGAIGYLEQGIFDYVNVFVRNIDGKYAALSHWSYRLGDEPAPKPKVRLTSMCVVSEGVGRVRFRSENEVGPITWHDNDGHSGTINGNETVFFEVTHPKTIIVYWSTENYSGQTTKAQNNTPCSEPTPTEPTPTEPTPTEPTPEPTPTPKAPCTVQQYVLRDTQGHICYIKRAGRGTQLPGIYDDTPLMREVCSKNCLGEPMPWTFGKLDAWWGTCQVCDGPCK